MFSGRRDPFTELLRPPLKFEREDELIGYLKQISEALTWVNDLEYPVSVADAMVSDFPTIAVSDALVREAKYTRMDFLFRNCRFLVELVSGQDRYRISKSDLEKMNAFCKLSRYPGAVKSGSAIRVSQPNVIGDGSCVTNHSVVFRVYVCGHPLLVGLHHFDKNRSPEPFEEFSTVISERMTRLTTQIIESESLRKLFQPNENRRGSNALALCDTGLFRGGEVPFCLLFFDGGRGVLRQEPQLLPQSGTIFVERPIPLRTDGSRRITLRLDTIINQCWPDTGGPPMGFTQTPPASRHVTSFTKLHFVGRTVGFTCIGPIVNHSLTTLEGVGNWKEQLDVYPMQPFPETCQGDVVTVKLTSNGELSRYRNGKLLHTVSTNTAPEGEWYGAFEVAMNVARATLLEGDPFLDITYGVRPESLWDQVLKVAQKVAERREIEGIRDMFDLGRIDQGTSKSVDAGTSRPRRRIGRF